MKIKIKLFKSFITFVTIFVFLLSFPSLAKADNCGKSDRVPVPSCINTQYNGLKQARGLNGYMVVAGSGEALWTNNCSEEVTLKFDKPGKDSRHTIASGDSIVEEQFQTLKVSCCPRYSRCDF